MALSSAAILERVRCVRLTRRASIDARFIHSVRNEIVFGTQFFTHDTQRTGPKDKTAPRLLNFCPRSCVYDARESVCKSGESFDSLPTFYHASYIKRVGRAAKETPDAPLLTMMHEKQSQDPHKTHGTLCCHIKSDGRLTRARR